MHEVLATISETKLVPVIKIEKPEDAEPLGRALIRAGLPIAEITLRTDAAIESIRRLSEQLPDLFLGAGTVLTVDQVKAAVDSGAKFIVSPGFNPRVVDYCVEREIPVTPGINNPTQIEMGLQRGLEVLKFFPAEASGGMALLKAMSAPYGGVSFIPTGGINPSNLASYLSFDRVLACGGSWMVSTELISKGDFDAVVNLCRQALTLVSKIK